MVNYKKILFSTFLTCVFLSSLLYYEGYAETKKLSAKEKRQARLLEKQKERTIKALYKEAMSYYRRGEFATAKDVFEQILSIDPTEKKAKLYVSKKLSPRIKSELERKEKKKAKEQTRAKRLAPKITKQEARHQRIEKRDKIKALYKEAMAYYRQDEITKAEETFKQILNIDPAEKKAKSWLAKKIPPARGREVKKRAREEAKAKREAPRKAKLEKRREKIEKEEKIKSLYKEALSYYRKGEITKSEETFKEILALDPDHESAKVYLAKRIPPARKQEIKKRAREEIKLTREAERIAKEEAEMKLVEVPLSDATKKILDERVREFLPKKEIAPELLRARGIHPFINSSMTYDDNIYLVDENIASPEGELITSINPGVEAYYGNLDHLLAVSYSANILLYDEHPDENRMDHGFGIRANLFKQSPIKLDVSESFKFTAAPPTSEVTNFVDRFNNAFTSAIKYDMSPKSSLGFNFNQYIQHFIPDDYEEYSYVQHAFSPILYWHLSPKTSITGGYSFGVTSYYFGHDDYDSVYHELTGGIEGNLTKKSTIYLKTGYQYRNYLDNDIVKDTNAYILSSMFEYKLTPKTTLEFIGSSNLNESTYTNAGYYRSWNLYGYCTHRLFNNLSLRGGVFYLRSDYPEAFEGSNGKWEERADNLFGITGRASYAFRDMFSLYFEYELRYRDSDIEIYDYVNNRITGGVSLRF